MAVSTEQPPDFSQEPGLPSQQAAQLRRYSLLVTVAMMIVCNAIFLLGMWVTGTNVEQLVHIPDVFNPTKDVCLRFIWQPVPGEEQPVRLCSEWINLSDPSGNTHTIQKQTQVRKGGDGRLYFDYGARVDYRLFLVAAFVGGIIVFGIWWKRQLIRRYRAQLARRTSVF